MVGNLEEREALSVARAKRWWRSRPPVRSLARAGAFVADVHFALLFPKPSVEMPTLYDAAADRSPARAGLEWGPDAERVWGWKDELPRRGLAWYGRFVRGMPSFLSPALLLDLYPRSGEPDDFLDEGTLGPDAMRIAKVILSSGPMPTGALREVVGAEGSRGGARFSRALSELGRALVITHHGVEEEGSGWPSAVLELTARALPLSGRAGSLAERRLSATRRFLDTMLVARPHELGNAFRMGAAAARAQLELMVDMGEAHRLGPAYALGS